ncbi:nuclear transport factor 2 family protein [bacterium]|nr:nuclear transport factor 2 family protein [bacterium]
MNDNYIKQYIYLFSNLNKKNIEKFDALVDQNIEFSDPFNYFKGITNFKKVFYHMFKNVKDPSFVILDYTKNKDKVFLKWKMIFYAFQSKQFIEGISEITLNSHGKIISHIDYWDSMNGLFVKIPFIGILYRLSLKIFKVKN